MSYSHDSEETHDTQLKQESPPRGLNKAIGSLSYAFIAQLTLSDNHQTTEFLKELLHISRYTDKLEVKTQDKLKVPGGVKQETEEKV